jgi:3-oxoacyl-[acyl-carrier protein] reductase
VDILIINHTHCELETFDPGVKKDHEFDVCLTKAKSINRHFAVNARAPALMMRDYLARHIARNADWGRIITLTTAFSHPKNISYAASKRALVCYTQTAAQEMGKYGITANVVCPGATQTGYMTPEVEAQLTAATPLGRVGSPTDAANVIMFLVSEQGGWITGQVIYSAGGFMMYPQ